MRLPFAFADLGHHVVFDPHLVDEVELRFEPVDKMGIENYMVTQVGEDDGEGH